MLYELMSHFITCLIASVLTVFLLLFTLSIFVAFCRSIFQVFWKKKISITQLLFKVDILAPHSLSSETKEFCKALLTRLYELNYIPNLMIPLKSIEGFKFVFNKKEIHILDNGNNCDAIVYNDDQSILGYFEHLYIHKVNSSAKVDKNIEEIEYAFSL